MGGPAMLYCGFMKIGLNAHLHSQQAGYRARRASMAISPISCAAFARPRRPISWQFEALVGAANTTLDLSASRCCARRWIRVRRCAASCLGADAAAACNCGDLISTMPWPLSRRLRLGTAPMVVTVYDLSFLRFPERLSAGRAGLYLRQMTALTCSRARRVLAISQSTADDLVRPAGRARGQD